MHVVENVLLTTKSCLNSFLMENCQVYARNHLLHLGNIDLMFLCWLCRGTEQWKSADAGSGGSRWDALNEPEPEGDQQTMGQRGTQRGGQQRNGGSRGGARWNNMRDDGSQPKADWSQPLPRNERIEK